MTNVELTQVEKTWFVENEDGRYTVTERHQTNPDFVEFNIFDVEKEEFLETSEEKFSKIKEVVNQYENRRSY